MSLQRKGDPRTEILYIEDDPGIVSLVEALVAPLGANVRSVHDVGTALACLRGPPPDLVLLDLLLPSGEGTEVLRAFRADVRWQDVPIIIVSARPSEKHRQQAIELGADDYLEKPFDLDELEAKLRLALRAIRRHRRVPPPELIETSRTVFRPTPMPGSLDTGPARFVHEIRNPLTAVRAALEILGSREMTHEQRARLASVAAAEAQRVVHLAEEYVAQRRSADRTREGVALNPLLAEIVEINLLGVAHPPTVVIDCDPDLPLLRGEAARVRQIVLNLLLNAIDATRPNAGRIMIRGQTDEGGALIEISDTGKGIPTAVLPRIFDERFTTRSTGDGLGLAIVRQIVDEEGGWIDVRSVPGEGTTFRVWLPPA